MGQIRKRGTFYQIRYYRNGQRIEETTEHVKYDDARDLLRKREAAVSDGVPITAKSTKLTFDDAVTNVETDYATNRKRSLSWLQRRVRLHLTPWFGGRRLSSITTADLRAFTAARLKAGASAAEINRELAIVRRAFRLAVTDDTYHGRVPAFPMLQERNVRSGFFDDAMVAAVRDRLPAAVRPVVTFAYITGWRIQSEVLPLEWRQVDREKEEVRLDPGTTKNQAGRVFPFTDALRVVIADLWTEHKALEKAGTLCPYVFHRHGRRIKGFRTAWGTACEAAGLPGRIPHDLRRSAVRNMERSGLSRSTSMKLTGHKTTAIFDRYAITAEGDLQEAVDRLNQAAGTKRGDKSPLASTDATKASA